MLVDYHILQTSLFVSLFSVFMFLFFCVQSNVFRYFGRHELNNKNFFILFIGSMIPMITSLLIILIGDNLLYELKIPHNIHLTNDIENKKINFFALFSTNMLILNHILFYYLKIIFKKTLMQNSLKEFSLESEIFSIYNNYIKNNVPYFEDKNGNFITILQLNKNS